MPRDGLARFAVMFLVVMVMGAIGTAIYRDYRADRQTTITVTQCNLAAFDPNINIPTHQVVTDKGTYQVAGSFALGGKTGSAAYGQLVVGATYRVHYYGFSFARLKPLLTKAEQAKPDPSGKNRHCQW